MIVNHSTRRIGTEPPNAAPACVSEQPAKKRTSRTCIAYIIHSMQIGGAERSIARLINVLDHERFAPLVICLTQTGPAADWIESADVPVIEIHKSPATIDRGALRRLTQVLIDHRVDVIHSHNWGTLLESVTARRRAGVAAHVHAERGSVLGAAEMAGWRMWLRGRLAGWAMRRCDAIVTNARSVAQRIEARCGFPADRVQVIGNGVETPTTSLSAEQIVAQRSQLGMAADAVVIGSIGRLVTVKGFDVAVRALASLQQRAGDFHLLLVGDGPERAALEALSQSLGVQQRVHLIGHQEDVGAWLSLMDIYVNTSHSEGMSQSLVEALAAGLPVIATDVGDSADVIGAEQGCGYVIAAGDCQGLCNRVIDLTEASTRRRMSQLGKLRHQSQFTSERMSQRYQTLYHSLSRRVSQDRITS